MGDWREEIILRSGDNQFLNVYTTVYETTHRIYTLMHDPQYRMAIAWQNAAYNQPPHPGFYLGDGMNPAPTPNIKLVNNITTATNDLLMPSLKVDVFPNPYVKTFSIQLNGLFTYQVFDVNGKLMLWGSGNGRTETGESLNAGVYFLRVQNKKQFYTQKILKQ